MYVSSLSFFQHIFGSTKLISKLQSLTSEEPTTQAAQEETSVKPAETSEAVDTEATTQPGVTSGVLVVNTGTTGWFIFKLCIK